MGQYAGTRSHALIHSGDIESDELTHLEPRHLFAKR
jgi:hypothetical protein